ncbi:hypothetical protein SLS60_002828 [Paraconiothyrium brasiliense]|uniref:Extracellular membrane protein CFEM domain-containing protein n=1 Tax=Paraconiothyrium brasiliense TaxID=300254 RepID=A0ABR3RU08_9PLEO
MKVVCICESSQDDDYLTSAVECAVQDCKFDGLNVALTFLAPLQMYCKATQDEIPDEILSSAYACATATTSATPSSTRKVEHSTQGSETSKLSGNGLKSTITSTVTVTTTNDNGNTLQVLIPIVMGPSTITTGDMVTSTLESKPTASPAATSNADAAASTAAAPSQPKQSSASSATAQATNIGNGSPFDLSAQGGSTRWSFSAALVGFGVLIGALNGL